MMVAPEQEGILQKGPYLPCLRMADRALSKLTTYKDGLQSCTKPSKCVPILWDMLQKVEVWELMRLGIIMRLSLVIARGKFAK